MLAESGMIDSLTTPPNHSRREPDVSVPVALTGRGSTRLDGHITRFKI
jgi:hypothetical protein